MGGGVVENGLIDIVDDDVGGSGAQCCARRWVDHVNADLIFENRPPASATDSPRSSAY